MRAFFSGCLHREAEALSPSGYAGKPLLVSPGNQKQKTFGCYGEMGLQREVEELKRKVGNLGEDSIESCYKVEDSQKGEMCACV